MSEDIRILLSQAQWQISSAEFEDGQKKSFAMLNTFQKVCGEKNTPFEY